jgi:integrase
MMTKKTAQCPIYELPLPGINTEPRVKTPRRREPMQPPRPYTEQEMAHIWSSLEKRGTTVTRLTCALGEESGLRIGEVMDIRLNDVDLDARRMFIRQRSRTTTETWVPFHDKTANYLKIWLAERDPSVKHDFLLHLPNGRSHNRRTLLDAIARVVCKTVGLRKVNEDGLDSWSFHRLRHTMASRLVSYGADAATVMAIGGWKTPKSMAGHIKLGYDGVDRRYRDAMARAAGHKS